MHSLIRLYTIEHTKIEEPLKVVPPFFLRPIIKQVEQDDRLVIIVLIRRLMANFVQDSLFYPAQL
jgi:hypothetical protein